MTLIKHAYVIVWPEQLVSIGEALAQADLDALRVQVERFPSPEVALFYRSDPSEPDYFTRITAYRVVMPLLYYLSRFGVQNRRKTGFNRLFIKDNGLKNGKMSGA